MGGFPRGPVTRANGSAKRILNVFGTRPEIIKVAPVIHELERWPDRFQTINVATGQHSELLYPIVELFKIHIDHDLQIMDTNQTPAGTCARALMLLDPLLQRYQPDMVLVQGDTTSTLAGALAGFYHRIPVGHIEAGLRSGNLYSPYPEEMNRTLVSQLATYHFAATPGNRDTLLREGVGPDQIFVTGNPVVDALKMMLERSSTTPETRKLLDETVGKKILAVTLHRRESLEGKILETLKVLRAFVEAHEDVVMIFPVHPNPRVRSAVAQVLGFNNRIHLIAPLNYQDFIRVLSASWLIVSDSGGVQEEAPTLGKRLLVVRENTERAEALETGFIRLVNEGPTALAAIMEHVYRCGDAPDGLGNGENPFGRGDSGKRIVQAIADVFNVRLETPQAVAEIQ
jgi:UDP-N-acetylglucosamine 2-epimerase (non-hydrolysing)